MFFSSDNGMRVGDDFQAKVPEYNPGIYIKFFNVFQKFL
jgi:hypothetical protein